MRSIAFLVGGLACCLCSNAQDAPDTSTVPPPKFPIPVRVGEKASWVVATKKTGQEDTATGNSSDPTPLVQKLEVVKALPLYFERATVSGGASWERWAVVSKDRIFQLTKDAGSTKWERLDGPRMARDGSDYSNADFEEFAWIDQSHYKGVTLLDDRPVYAFEMKTHRPVTQRERMNFSEAVLRLSMEEEKSEGREIAGRTIKAWVDAETLLPYRYDDGVYTKSYAFGSAPGTLSLPKDAVAALKDWLNTIKARSR